MKVCFAFIIGLLLTTLAFAQPAANTSAAQGSNPTKLYQLDIPTQALSSAITSLAKQTDLQVLFFSELAKGKRANQLKGFYSADQAFGALLKDTGLSYKFLQDGAVTISAANALASQNRLPVSSLKSQASTMDLPASTQQEPTVESTSQPTGKFSGTVRDDTGAVLPGVNITILNEATKWERQTVTDNNGVFQLLQLPSGTYTLKAILAGFVSYEEKAIVLKAGEEKTVQIRLDLAPVEEAIVVTGTSIRAHAPVGSEPIVIDKEEIERSGWWTVNDAVRSLPQNYGGSVSEEFAAGAETDPEGFSNTTDGTSPNLRGLGAGSTLVLINGRRIAPTGSEGIYTDLANIPLSAVERIEVLLDGASAIYGSAAVGGVVNVILRQDYRGAETIARAGTVTEGSSQEYQIAQNYGDSWSTGHGFVSYEFYKREGLNWEDRTRSASCDQTSFGGNNFCLNFSNPGTIFAGLSTYAIPRGQDGTSLSPADFVEGTVNLGNRNIGQGLLPEQQRNSVSGFISQSVGDRLILEGTGMYTARKASNSSHGPLEFLFVTSDHPFYVNPAGGTDPIFIAYDFHDDLGPQTTETEIDSYSTAFTGKIKASETWLVTTDLGYSHEVHDRTVGGLIDSAALFLALSDPNPATVFNPFGDGSHTNPATLDTIRGEGFFSGNSDLLTLRLDAEGPLWSLPGGEMRLAVGAEYDKQDFISRGVDVSGVEFESEYDREISAAYSELLIPLVGSDNRRSGVNRLEFSVAGRYEEYGDFGDTFNPKFGLRWAPVDGLDLRGSWGTSFKAPNVFDLDESSNFSFIFPVPDFESPSGFTNTLIWLGGNADLVPETADTWNFGVGVSPPSIPLNFRLSYFDIDFTDRIELVFFDPFAALQDPSVADVVIRNPTPEQREEVCSRSTFDGDINDCLNAPVGALLDGRIGNSAIVKTRGIDLFGSYGLDTDIGLFDFGLNATYQFEFSRAIRETSPLLEILDTPFNPLKFRLRGSVSWAQGRFQTIGYLNYADSYIDTVSEPDRNIDSWTTVDITASYRLLSNTLLVFTAQNLFDADPPYFNNSIGYDAVNSSLLGRVISFQVRFDWDTTIR